MKIVNANPLIIKAVYTCDYLFGHFCRKCDTGITSLF